MIIDKILHTLPSSIEWMVLFDVDVFRNIAGDETFKEMYFINKSTDLNKYNYVILSAAGRYLTESNTDILIHGETLEELSFDSKSYLFQEYKDYLSSLNYNEAHCLAVANIGRYGKVVLFIEIANNVANAKAVFDKKPSKEYYEYLQAIGVSYYGGDFIGGKFIAYYLNKIPIHIHSGILNHFTRTDNCNIFFFNHGNIDQMLFEGLYTAYFKRKEWMQTKLEKKLTEIAEKSLHEKVAMDWLPPSGPSVFPFGDVVPLGFLNFGLGFSSQNELNEKIKIRLYKEQVRGLWPFESNDLETSIDSALVLLGLKDEKAIKELSRFWNGIFGYMPQLASENPSEGQMQYVEEKKHWCQVDLAITCLIYSQQKEAGLATMIETENFILNSFYKRAGLYFANPYMVDWFYAKALKHISKSTDLKEQLINDILSSLNTDYSVGKFDKALSSAFAVLALTELGYKGHAIAALQLYIINNFDNEAGTNIPFYSSLLLPSEQAFEGRLVIIDKQKVQVSFHKDTHDAIFTSICYAALKVESDSSFKESKSIENYTNQEEVLLYRHNNLLEYLENHALVTYVE
ncbi:MAG: hypothetical protein H6587_13120 [Flavobacteriales bacterium]|nr:hypothetical protein [Flavobacteriales bacterium]